jgi:hypothetical protein
MNQGYEIDFREFCSLWESRDSLPICSDLESLVEAFGRQIGVTPSDRASLHRIHDAIQASTSQYSLYHLAMTVWR